MLTLFAVALGGFLTGAVATLFGIRLWLRIVYTGDVTLVEQELYRVTVAGRPDASGRVYMLSHGGEYLLALTSKLLEHPPFYEPYYIDLSSRRIGLLNCDKYKHIPFLRCALVNADIYDGFPLDGALVADWKMDNDWKEVRIQITGFVQEESHHFEEYMRELLPIAYGNEIILTGGSY